MPLHVLPTNVLHHITLVRQCISQLQILHITDHLETNLKLTKGGEGGGGGGGV